ncbi:Nem1-Spo7 phosphatase regulatory subunit [Extremus antarcticus]|uniref:Nem1-Spo7 phosphatase regulatory subunit n=1 Tax=Extremus antarcticus TaxID=702011 RepID=A0AAJ0GGI3_9PEZI|nr:Nem1-Spo7 phosphatase regulatory subunit [Extremus antarcticus]
MSDSKLDQIVKGAPPPNVSPSQVAESARATSQSDSVVAPHLPTTSDPRDSLPSSPPQIYLNLLILESSLRLQYLSLRARLRLHLLLLAGLLAWTLTFTYLLFFRPREDGSGVGGSVYWVLETIEKLGWCSGIVTLCLFWGTGMYERGVRWPRKFVGTTNRGLRGFNMKVVLVKGSLLSELLGWLSMLDPSGWFREENINFQVLPKDIEAGGTKEHWNQHAARHGLVEEDIAPSGDVLKLLLLPKPFSPDFREGWETYRMEYWDKENARRAELRKIVKLRIREVARQEGGWLWWTGWRGFHSVRFYRGKTRRQIDLEKLALKDKPSSDRLKEEKRKKGLLRAESHSRSSSRSSTPTPEPESRRPIEGRVRRGSSTGATRRPKKGSAATSRLSATESILGDDNLSPLSNRGSTLSSSSEEADDNIVVKKEESAERKIKQEPI